MMKLINLTSLVGPHTREELAARFPLPGVGSRVGRGGGGVSSSSPPQSRARKAQKYPESLVVVVGWGGRGMGISFPREVLLVFISEKLSKYIKCDTKSYIIHFSCFCTKK